MAQSVHARGRGKFRSERQRQLGIEYGKCRYKDYVQYRLLVMLFSLCDDSSDRRL